MTSSEFKSGLKEIKDYLKGITLSLSAKNSVHPYYSLNEFGYEVLRQESYGKSFAISTVWTNEGIKSAKSFSELIQLFKAFKVSAVRFSAFREEVYDECSYMRSFGRLD
jgi:hypothetical protein